RAGRCVGTSGERHDLRELGAIAYASRTADGRVTPSGFVREFARRVARDRSYRTCPQYLASRLAGVFDIEGPTATIQTACTSSAQAIGEAYRAIRRGTVDVALAGGAECIVSPIEVQLFCLLGVMSRQNASPETASRPFDARRDGFVMGEGAGFLVLEEAEHARQRGVQLLAEVAGYGTTCDAYRITDEAPDGRGAIRAIRAALGDASLGPEDLDYVNAHGTSTPMNDRVETAAIKVVIPVFNEAKSLGDLHDRLTQTLKQLGQSHEIIFVDDGSRDGSTDILRALHTQDRAVRVIRFNRNYGQHAAVSAGMERARGDVIVTLDADLQNPPEEIPRLLAALTDGVDVVGGRRVSRRDPLFRRLASWVVNRVTSAVVGVRMRDYGCMLRAYRRSVVDRMLACDGGSHFIPALANT